MPVYLLLTSAPTLASGRMNARYIREQSLSRLTKLKDKIEKTAFGSGYVCNCVEHDPKRYEFVWSCDNKGINATEADTNHQYG